MKTINISLFLKKTVLCAIIIHLKKANVNIIRI